MGGLMFIIAIIVGSLIAGMVGHMLTPVLLILLFILILYGLLGMWDDSIKLFRRQNEGLKAWQKLLGQIVGAVVFLLVYLHEGLPLGILIPGLGNLNLGWLYFFFVAFWLVGFSNAVNLTDGLDGLVAGLATISFATSGSSLRTSTSMTLCYSVLPLSAVSSLFWCTTTNQRRSSWVTWGHWH